MIAPRVISFDLDDTLWPVAPVIAAAEAALQSWLREHHPRAVHGFTVDSMRNLRARVAERFPLKSHDLTFVRRQALAEMFAAAGYPDGPAADVAFEIFLSHRNRVEFYADALPALMRLRARYRLFALSNGNADLERCGIADLFEGHVTASAAGAAKPDARIYAHLLRAAGVPAIEVLHVGDDPLADVVGATQAGLQAVWLNRDARTWPEQFAAPARTVTTLADIL
jgi:putative hydrolase of the HAD superfamily